MGSERICVGLGRQLDVCASGPLVGELLAARGNDVGLDASAVERLGTQCLQVLLSAAATWRADGTALSVVEPSPAFCEALAIAGVGLGDLTAARGAAADGWRE